MSQTLRWLSSEWMARLASAYEAMAGEALNAQPVTPPADSSSWQAPHCWKQSFDLAPGAFVEVAMPSEGWLALGRKVLAAAGIEDAEEDDARSTYGELLQQSLSGLAGAITSRVGREVNPGSGETAAAPLETPNAAFSLATGSGLTATVVLLIPPQLVAAIDQAAAPTPRQPQESPSASAPEALRPTGSQTSSQTSSMDLLYDVELPVSVSFGRAHLPLKEVLRLTSGSIVELNRGIAEPVELIVNNCVVARGEVVVVEGNYGVRVQQVISRSERLRTLH